MACRASGDLGIETSLLVISMVFDEIGGRLAVDGTLLLQHAYYIYLGMAHEH